MGAKVNVKSMEEIDACSDSHGSSYCCKLAELKADGIKASLCKGSGRSTFCFFFDCVQEYGMLERMLVLPDHPLHRLPRLPLHHRQDWLPAVLLRLPCGAAS